MTVILVSLVSLFLVPATGTSCPSVSRSCFDGLMLVSLVLSEFHRAAPNKTSEPSVLPFCRLKCTKMSYSLCKR